MPISVKCMSEIQYDKPSCDITLVATRGAQGKQPGHLKARDNGKPRTENHSVTRRVLGQFLAFIWILWYYLFICHWLDFIMTQSKIISFGSGCGELPRSLARLQCHQSLYQFIKLVEVKWHTCVFIKWYTFGWINGLLPIRHWTIILTDANLSRIRSVRIYFCAIWIQRQHFRFKFSIFGHVIIKIGIICFVASL